MGTNSDNLRTSIMRTPTTRLQQPLAGLPSSHPKIRHLDILLFIQQQILRLEIPMADVEAMAVVDRVDDLLEVVEGFILL